MHIDTNTRMTQAALWALGFLAIHRTGNTAGSGGSKTSMPAAMFSGMETKLSSEPGRKLLYTSSSNRVVALPAPCTVMKTPLAAPRSDPCTVTCVYRGATMMKFVRPRR